MNEIKIWIQFYWDAFIHYLANFAGDKINSTENHSLPNLISIFEKYGPA